MHKSQINERDVLIEYYTNNSIEASNVHGAIIIICLLPIDIFPN